jgi:hypothetical protein
MNIPGWKTDHVMGGPRRLLALALLLAGGAAAAAPVCLPGSVFSYQSASPCALGAITIGNFAVEPFPGVLAQQIDPTSILLTPLANGFALSSSQALSASAGELLGLRLVFRASDALFSGASIELGADHQATGDGVITGVLDAGAGGAIALIADGIEDNPASFSSPISSIFDVFVEIGIDGGTGGFASLGPQLASLRFDAVASRVPEPPAIWLLLPGLVGLATSRRAAAAT